MDNNNYMNDIQKAPFLFLQNHPQDFNTPMKRVLSKGKTIGCDDQIMQNTFFSQLNIDYINNRVMKTVYNNSCEKFIIRKQKSEHLYQIMESIWEDHAQHMSTGQKEQIMILNNLVIDFCVDTILEEIKTRTLYLRDKFAKPMTLPDPINDSIAGTKSYAPQLSNGFDNYDIYSRTDDVDNVYNRKAMPNEDDAIIHEDYQINYKYKM